MKKSLINTIVRNIIFEVAKENDIELEVTKGMEFESSIDFYFEADGLLKRGLTVRYYEGYTVSHGIHSPSDNTSDLLQQIICGRVADRLLKENLKIN